MRDNLVFVTQLATDRTLCSALGFVEKYRREIGCVFVKLVPRRLGARREVICQCFSYYFCFPFVDFLLPIEFRFVETCSRRSVYPVMFSLMVAFEALDGRDGAPRIWQPWS
jgi:hypothetical protein